MTLEELSASVCEASPTSPNFDSSVYESNDSCCLEYLGPENYHDWCSFCKRAIGVIGTQAFIKTLKTQGELLPMTSRAALTSTSELSLDAIALELTDICVSADPPLTPSAIVTLYRAIKSELQTTTTDTPVPVDPSEPQWSQLGPNRWKLEPFTLHPNHLSVQQTFSHTQPIPQLDVNLSIVPDLSIAESNKWKSIGWIILGNRHTDWKNRVISMDLKLSSGHIRLATAQDKKVHVMPAGYESGFNIRITLDSQSSKTFITISSSDGLIDTSVECSVAPFPVLLFGFGNNLPEESNSVGFTIESVVKTRTLALALTRNP